MEKQRRTSDHAAAAEPRAARDILVAGAVQGVGFRPFVHALATGLDLAGEVRNTSAGVEVRVEGSAAALDAFVARLVDDAPPLALVEDLSWVPAVPRGVSGFRITPSEPGRRVDTLVTADAATCDDCLAEIVDSRNRRYRYPFTNCTNCGPRFTITREVPYDRPATTMSTFRMCPDCEREYHDPTGPTLSRPAERLPGVRTADWASSFSVGPLGRRPASAIRRDGLAHHLRRRRPCGRP